MANNKNYLDFEGLQYYHGKLQEWINGELTEMVSGLTSALHLKGIITTPTNMGSKIDPSVGDVYFINAGGSDKAIQVTFIDANGIENIVDLESNDAIVCVQKEDQAAWGVLQANWSVSIPEKTPELNHDGKEVVIATIGGKEIKVKDAIATSDEPIKTISEYPGWDEFQTSDDLPEADVVADAIDDRIDTRYKSMFESTSENLDLFIKSEDSVNELRLIYDQGEDGSQVTLGAVDVLVAGSDEQKSKLSLVTEGALNEQIATAVVSAGGAVKAGDGLSKVNTVISVALYEPTDGSKNHLELIQNGDKKELAVTEIDANATVLQKDLVVAGLTDGSIGAGNYSNGTTIPAGTDIYTILENILCKELYPTNVTTKEGSVSVLMKDLTVDVDHSGTVEVGTLVKLNAANTNGVTTTITESIVSGMEYGYSYTNDNSKDSTNTSITGSIENLMIRNENDASNYSISVSLTGFNAGGTTYPKANLTSQSGSSVANIHETTLGCVSEGENKIIVSGSGAVYKYSVQAVDSVYYCSNLGNTNKDKKTQVVNAIEDKETSIPTTSVTKTITGAYKYFMGYYDATDKTELTSDIVRSLNIKTGNIVKDGKTVIVNDDFILSNGKSILIACPSIYKLATIQNSMGVDILPNFSSIKQVSVTCGSIQIEYTVYLYPIANNTEIEFKNVTLTKV